MFLLLFSFLSIVFLMAVLSDFHSRKIPDWLTYPTLVTAVVYYFRLVELKCFLFNPGRIDIRIFILIFPFLMGGVEV